MVFEDCGMSPARNIEPGSCLVCLLPAPAAIPIRVLDMAVYDEDGNALQACSLHCEMLALTGKGNRNEN